MFKKISSLRRKLLLTVLLLLSIPMIIVVIIAQTRSQAVISEQARNLSTNLVNTGAERLDTSCKRLNDIYRSIYLNDSFRDYLKEFNNKKTSAEKLIENEKLKSIFLSSLSSRADIFSIIYVDISGQITYATRTEAGFYSDYKARNLPDNYKTCIETDELWREKAILLPTDGHIPLRNEVSSSPTFVYAIARQIVNTECQFERVGTMFITIDLSDFEQMRKLIQPDISTLIFICDKNGKTIYDSSKEYITKNLPAEICEVLGTSGSDIIFKGSHYIMASSKSEFTDWYVLMLTPKSVFSADAMAVSSAILTAAIITLIAVSIITVLASSAISKPVEQLAEAMDETRLRHLDRRVQITGNDEIARLGNSFNSLMDKLDVSIQNEYDAALQQKSAEIRALQAQMNPHFLYNVLQSMASMATLHNVPALATMATALGNTMRYNISGREPFVSIRDEINHVENYLTIQKIRFGDRINFDINVPEYVMDWQVPRVSIQPMVENAVIHGFDGRECTGNIFIGAWEENGKIIIEVADDGKGIAPGALALLQENLSCSSNNDGVGGIGIKNLYSRLKLLYGDNASLTIESEEETGTVVRIMIPNKRR